MGQAIAKISRFIIHIICKDGNSEKRTHCNLDNNSSCSTDVAAEANEPLITATHDDLHVISIQTTLDDYLSCSSNVVVESNEPLITTTHDSYVISIQTLDDNSSCSSDVVAELKDLLIATTDHDSHVISIQTLDDNSSCSTDVVAELKELLIATTDHDSHAISIQVEDKDHDPPCADNCNRSKSSGDDNKNNAKVKEIATVTIPKRSKVKREGKWLRASPAVEKKNTGGEGKKVGILPTPAASMDPTFLCLPRSDSNYWSVASGEKVGISSILPSPPTADNCNRSKSNDNYNKNNAKVKDIATVTIPKPPKVKKEGKWLRVSPAVEKKNAGGEGKKVGILPTPAASMDPTFLCLPRSNSNYWSVVSGEKVGISSILPSSPTADNCNHSKSNDNDNKNNAKVKNIATVTIPKPPKVKEDKWLRISPVVEKKNAGREGKKVEILPTPLAGKEIATVTIPKPPKVKREGKLLKAFPVVEKKNVGRKGKKVEILPTPPVVTVNSTFLHLPRSNSNCWSVANGEKVKILPISPFPPTAGNGTRHYCSNHRILLVGEGDFSFSACLAKAFGFADNMVATSLNSLDFLEKNYPNAKTNIGCLRNRGGTVLHKVDATNMEFNILVNEYIYDRIIFNFPLAGFIKESRRQHLKRNRKLVRSFMENAKNLMASDGEIHIRHKTSSMYQEWGMENLAKQCGLKLIEEVEFKLSDYPGYHNKYGFGGNDDFNCHPSKTYKFGLK